jgi:hypothetical protein
MVGEKAPVQVHVGDGHHPLEFNIHLLAPEPLHAKVLAIPGDEPKHVRVKRFMRCNDVGMRYAHTLEGNVVKLTSLGVRFVPRAEEPSRGEVDFAARCDVKQLVVRARR